MTGKRPLWQWSASDLATATRDGSLTAVEVTEAAIARMDAVNPDLNAVVEKGGTLTFPSWFETPLQDLYFIER